MGFYLMDFTIQQSTKFSVFIMYFVFQKNPKLLGKLFSLFRKTYLRETLRPLRNAIFSFLSIPAWHRLKGSKAIKLDLGSGAKRGSNGWTTVDITGADISHDLRKKIPLPNNSVSEIYSSHLLEHIPFHQQRKFLQECRRILKPGGKLSISVPNARLYIQSYIEGREFLSSKSGFNPGKTKTGSLIDQINYIAYMGGHHKFMFDEQNLVKILRMNQFANVSLRSFDPLLDPSDRRHESLYAQAVK